MTQNVSETLNRAADLIEKRGWTHGGGWNGTAEAGPLCTEGAIQAAMGVSVGAGYRCDAYWAVAEYIGIEFGLFVWNDNLPWSWHHPKGSAEETFLISASDIERHEFGQAKVIETLRAAALVAAAREVDVMIATRPAGSSATWSPPTPLAVVPVEVGA